MYPVKNKKKQKTKFAICEVHKNALSDTDKRIVKWYEAEKMWMCCSCERDPVLQAMARINRKINKQKPIN